MLVDMALRHRAAPSSASAPFDTTLVDGSGIVIYFSIALLFLSGALLQKALG
jgi:Mg/Co/Ni transporter MgtE